MTDILSCRRIASAPTMKMSEEIRPALPSAAEEISRVIVRALRETNRQDSSAHVVTAIAENYSPKLSPRRGYVRGPIPGDQSHEQ